MQKMTSPFTGKQTKVCGKRHSSICPDHCGSRTENGLGQAWRYQDSEGLLS